MNTYGRGVGTLRPPHWGVWGASPPVEVMDLIDNLDRVELQNLKNIHLKAQDWGI